jgi:hypothetical protein
MRMRDAVLLVLLRRCCRCYSFFLLLPATLQGSPDCGMPTPLPHMINK